MQSKQWRINGEDIKHVLKWTAIFFAAPILMYLAQLNTQLDNGVITTLVPNEATIGAIESWAIGIAINFFLALEKGK